MKRLLRIGVLILLVSSICITTSFMPGISVDVTMGFLSISFEDIAVSAYPANWYEDTNLQNGLWYQDINNPIIVGGYQVSFMKIYSINGTLKCMELSTYPRAYKNTGNPVYLVDTPFVVTLDDLNNYYDSQYAAQGGYQIRNIPDGTHIYVDTKHLVFLQGEAACHYAGDPLPGEYPLWIESEYLPTPSWVDNKNSVFPTVFQAVKGELVQVVMYEGYYRQNTDTAWTKIPQALFDTYVQAFTQADTQVKITKIVKNKDRTIIRILYDRIID